MQPILTNLSRAMLLSGALLVSACGGDAGPQPGQVLDEARQAGRGLASFPHAAEDYFHDMDRGIHLSEDEIKGRNMWIVWTGGNDRFWDVHDADTPIGAFDLLKIVTSHPSQTNYSTRAKRWKYLGLVNEPCFRDADRSRPPTASVCGWINAIPVCAPDPFANEAKYPGVRIGARGATFADGTTMPVGSYYG